MLHPQKGLGVCSVRSLRVSVWEGAWGMHKYRVASWIGDHAYVSMCSGMCVGTWDVHMYGWGRYGDVCTHAYLCERCQFPPGMCHVPACIDAHVYGNLPQMLPCPLHGPTLHRQRSWPGQGERKVVMLGVQAALLSLDLCLTHGVFLDDLRRLTVPQFCCL